MLVGFKTPAWVLEIAGKTHQTRPQITILIVIEVCAAPRAWTHELALSLAAAVLTQVLPRLRDSSSNSGNSSSVRVTAKVKGSHVSRAPRAWSHELASSLAAAVPTRVLP